ncbi:MAG: SRPBCC family protein [Chloroflexi bacterium]|nr:SRPBCC family protein [Chloroflexota bacterium]
MINLNISTMIYRPVTQIFDFMSTPENDFQWQYETLASNRLSRDVSAKGSFFRSVGHLMGHRVISSFEVTEYEPNRKYAFKSLSGPLNSHTSYTFEMVGRSTKVEISAQMNTVNSLQFSESILEKKMRKQLKENLALLKEILETKRTQPVGGAILAVN